MNTVSLSARLGESLRMRGKRGRNGESDCLAVLLPLRRLKNPRFGRARISHQLSAAADDASCPDVPSLCPPQFQVNRGVGHAHPRRCIPRPALHPENPPHFPPITSDSRIARRTHNVAMGVNIWHTLFSVMVTLGESGGGKEISVPEQRSSSRSSPAPEKKGVGTDSRGREVGLRVQPSRSVRTMSGGITAPGGRISSAHHEEHHGLHRA